MKRHSAPAATAERTPSPGFPQRLRAARLRAGLTQARLAGDRYTKAYISALENGLSRPSIVALDYLAERLGTSSTDLLGEGPARWLRIEVDLRLAAGDWQAALDAYDEQLGRETFPVRRAEVQRGRAEALSRLDRPGEAVTAAADAAALFTAHGLAGQAAIARCWQAAGLGRLGNSDEARALLRDILEVARSGAAPVEPDIEVRALVAMAMIESREGEPARALTHLGEARARVGGLDDRRRAGLLESLARSYRDSGDYEAAVATANRAIAGYRAAGDALEVALLDNELALAHLALGTLDRAREHATAAHQRMAAAGDASRLAGVLETEARIALASGDLDEAEGFAGAAPDAAGTSGDAKAAASAALTRARVARRRGEPERAVAILEAAIAAARERGLSPQLRDCLVELSEITAEQGDTKRAYQLAREALG